MAVPPPVPPVVAVPPCPPPVPLVALLVPGVVGELPQAAIAPAPSAIHVNRGEMILRMCARGYARRTRGRELS
jgi:hypothetical protein